jgi:release factor glutamine methyltransferase
MAAMNRVEAQKMLTVREALRLGIERLRKEKIESASLDMSLILAETLGINRLGLYLNLDRPLNEQERLAARTLLARRLKHEPMAYILGRREFYGLTFEVTKDVLIPRPETEHLVEQAIAWIKAQAEAIPEPLLADIGVGSGAIAVAVAHACPESRWIATDLSNPALAVARRNAERHGVESRIEFRQGPLLEPIGEMLDGICCNPPYVALAERDKLERDVIDWEPPSALFSGPEGLDHIRDLIATAPARLKPGALLLIECGLGQDEPITELITENGHYGLVRIHADLAGIGRVVQTERA